MRKIYVILLLIVFGVGFYFIDKKENVCVTVEFPKMHPVSKRIDVFFKGFKIGKMKRIYPCENSKNVCVDISIKDRKMFLPSNIEIKMKQKMVHEKKYIDFMDIIYPENPHYKKLEDGAKIKGELFLGAKNYMVEEVSHDEMEQIKFSILNAAQNAEKISSILLDLFTSLYEITEGSKDNLEGAFTNLNKTMKNLNSITNKADLSISQKTLEDIFLQMDYAAKNLNTTTKYIKKMTQDISSESPNIGSILNSTNSITQNVDEILNGINCSLSKPFGGFRILFGKTTN